MIHDYIEILRLELRLTDKVKALLNRRRIKLDSPEFIVPNRTTNSAKILSVVSEMKLLQRRDVSVIVYVAQILEMQLCIYRKEISGRVQLRKRHKRTEINDTNAQK
jgi:hypothetical protein